MEAFEKLKKKIIPKRFTSDELVTWDSLNNIGIAICETTLGSMAAFLSYLIHQFNNIYHDLYEVGAMTNPPDLSYVTAITALLAGVALADGAMRHVGEFYDKPRVRHGFIQPPLSKFYNSYIKIASQKGLLEE